MSDDLSLAGMFHTIPNIEDTTYTRYKCIVEFALRSRLIRQILLGIVDHHSLFQESVAVRINSVQALRRSDGDVWMNAMSIWHFIQLRHWYLRLNPTRTTLPYLR